jgi:WD40 repeat protein
MLKISIVQKSPTTCRHHHLIMSGIFQRHRVCFVLIIAQSSEIIGRLKEFLSSTVSQGDADAESTTTSPKPRIWVIDIGEERYYEVSWSSDGSDPLLEGGVDKLRQLVDDAQNEKLAYKPLRG